MFFCSCLSFRLSTMLESIGAFLLMAATMSCSLGKVRSRSRSSTTSKVDSAGVRYALLLKCFAFNPAIHYYSYRTRYKTRYRTSFHSNTALANPIH